jgi:hypothetical protein
LAKNRRYTNNLALSFTDAIQAANTLGGIVIVAKKIHPLLPHTMSMATH